MDAADEGRRRGVDFLHERLNLIAANSESCRCEITKLQTKVQHNVGKITQLERELDIEKEKSFSAKADLQKMMGRLSSWDGNSFRESPMLSASYQPSPTAKAWWAAPSAKAEDEGLSLFCESVEQSAGVPAPGIQRVFPGLFWSKTPQGFPAWKATQDEFVFGPEDRPNQRFCDYIFTNIVEGVTPMEEENSEQVMGNEREKSRTPRVRNRWQDYDAPSDRVCPLLEENETRLSIEVHGAWAPIRADHVAIREDLNFEINAEPVVPPINAAETQREEAFWRSAGMFQAYKAIRLEGPCLKGKCTTCALGRLLWKCTLVAYVSAAMGERHYPDMVQPEAETYEDRKAAISILQCLHSGCVCLLTDLGRLRSGRSRIGQMRSRCNDCVACLMARRLPACQMIRIALKLLAQQQRDEQGVLAAERQACVTAGLSARTPLMRSMQEALGRCDFITGGAQCEPCARAMNGACNEYAVAKAYAANRRLDVEEFRVSRPYDCAGFETCTRCKALVGIPMCRLSAGLRARLDPETMGLKLELVNAEIQKETAASDKIFLAQKESVMVNMGGDGPSIDPADSPSGFPREEEDPLSFPPPGDNNNTMSMAGEKLLGERSRPSKPAVENLLNASILDSLPVKGKGKSPSYRRVTLIRDSDRSISVDS